MAYIPKPGEWVNVFSRPGGHKTIGCPCKTQKVLGAYIIAIDSNEMIRQFYYGLWRFEKVSSEPQR